MRPSEHREDHRFALEQACALLQAPARALTLSWELESHLRKRIKLQDRRGLIADHPILEISPGRNGLTLEVGMELYRFQTSEHTILLVKVRLPGCDHFGCPLHEFWAVRNDEHDDFYRAVRQLTGRSTKSKPPIMPAADRDRLWANTIGFLQRGRAAFRRYGIPQKRGVLLMGEPGNGKTMACRWLSVECRRRGLRWRSVTVEEYSAACENNAVGALFHLDRPGIVLFDDFDAGLRDREKFGPTRDHAIFLAELDGLQAKRGIVYVFTSNLRFEDLDPAFRRPGRIDAVIVFSKPAEALRRELIETAWRPDIVEALDVCAVARQTAGLSFAELEELRKLLVLHYIDTQAWDWSHAWQVFSTGRLNGSARKAIGFSAVAEQRQSGELAGLPA